MFQEIKNKNSHLTEEITIKESGENYFKVLEVIKERKALFFIFVSFIVLILAGFNNTFFVLFLKNLGWSQNQILLFNALLSFIFLPISIFVIREISKFRSEINISLGSQIVGIFSILLGGLASILNFYYIFFIMLGKSIGVLMTSSGRSGLLTTKLKEFPEESAAIDTIFAPLATAVGALIGGLIIGPIGYFLIFIIGGILIWGAGIIGKKFVKI